MTDFPIEKIVPLCAGFSVNLTNEQINRLNIYGNLLLSRNEQINLTAITDPYDIVIKHFYDCILFFKNIEVKQNAKIIDVGTGAGFPGIVLKIIRPDIELTLLDGLNKRLVFLSEVLENTGLDAKTVHLRAEEGGKKAEFRERFDIASARAVAKYNVLCEYCLPFIKVGGMFVAMKGPAATDELKACENALSLLGAGKPQIFREALPNGDERNFIAAKKISQTPPKYPRIFSKIQKQPL